jgi:hypothetical protein
MLEYPIAVYPTMYNIKLTAEATSIIKDESLLEIKTIESSTIKMNANA